MLQAGLHYVGGVELPKLKMEELFKGLTNTPPLPQNFDEDEYKDLLKALLAVDENGQRTATEEDLKKFKARRCISL